MSKRLKMLGINLYRGKNFCELKLTSYVSHFLSSWILFPQNTQIFLFRSLCQQNSTFLHHRTFLPHKSGYSCLMLASLCPHSTCCGQQHSFLKDIQEGFSTIKYYEFGINVIYRFDKTMMYGFCKNKIEIFALADLQLSSLRSKIQYGVEQASRGQHVLVSNFWLAHRTMPKFDREVKIKSVGKSM